MMLLATFICLHLAIVTSHPLLDNLESTQDGEPAAVEDDSLSMGTLHLTAPPHKRVPADYLVTDCMEVRSEEGTYYYKAGPDWEAGKACGIYLFTDPDRRVEIHFNYVDVPCQKGGLVSFVDGWELNGQFFPSPEDHPRPLDERFTEFCGQRKVKQVFESSQNAALIQYRMPMRGRGFSFSVRFLKNPSPCNVLLQSTGDMYTLRNYGKRSNCSLSALYPAVVRVAALSVGLAGASRSVEIETGIIHKCHKRSLGDYVQIGGSDGLDNTNLIMDDSVCGMDSKPESSGHVIFCGVTTVRLVSSGAFDNSVTIVMRPATEEDIVDASVVCGI